MWRKRQQNNAPPVYGAVHAGWGGDAPVQLDSLAVRFRQDTGAFPPMEASFFTPAFSSFRLYADGGEEGLLLDATQDPHVANDRRDAGAGPREH